jgi:hypothetical protein
MTRMSWRLAGASQGVPALLAELAVLQDVLRAAADEATLDRATDAVEVLTIALAETPGQGLACCLGKARVLHERLLEMLDPSVPGESATLALVASLLQDLEHPPQG